MATSKILMKLVEFLEKAGYKEADKLVNDILLPIVQEERISILEAARQYADSNEEQDTSWYQLWKALQNMSEEDYNFLKQQLEVEEGLKGNQKNNS